MTSANQSDPLSKFKCDIPCGLSKNRSLIYQSYNHDGAMTLFFQTFQFANPVSLRLKLALSWNPQSFVRSFISTVDFYMYMRCNLSEDWNQAASINCGASLIQKKLLSAELNFFSFIIWLFIVCQLVPHPLLRHPAFFEIRFVFIHQIVQKFNPSRSRISLYFILDTKVT